MEGIVYIETLVNFYFPLAHIQIPPICVLDTRRKEKQESKEKKEKKQQQFKNAARNY